MANFAMAIKRLLEHEGGYTEDHVGATNFGITLRSLDVDIDLDGDIDADDIRAMTIEDAKAFYFRTWWIRYKYDRIYSDEIAAKVFDLAVNMGARQAAKIVQKGWLNRAYA
jgi:lysozyme family protein